MRTRGRYLFFSEEDVGGGALGVEADRLLGRLDPGGEVTVWSKTLRSWLSKCPERDKMTGGAGESLSESHSPRVC